MNELIKIFQPQIIKLTESRKSLGATMESAKINYYNEKQLIIAKQKEKSKDIQLLRQNSNSTNISSTSLNATDPLNSLNIDNNPTKKRKITSKSKLLDTIYGIGTFEANNSLTRNILYDMKIIDTLYSFQLLLFPNEIILPSLTMKHIKCKGNVSMQSIKNLILTQINVSKSITIHNIELIVSIPVCSKNNTTYFGENYYLTNDLLL